MTESGKRDHYGGTEGELHPEREAAINAAQQVYEDGLSGPLERVMLFLDLEHNRLSVEVEQLKWELDNAKNALNKQIDHATKIAEERDALLAARAELDPGHSCYEGCPCSEPD